MLSVKYTIMIALLVGVTAPACTKVTRHLVPFEPSTEILHRGQTELFAKSSKLSDRSRSGVDDAHIQYLSKLVGRSCSDNKWNELTVKSLRKRLVTNDAQSIDAATYAVHDSKMRAGDIIYFAPRSRSTTHGVVVKHLGEQTYSAYALIRGRISKIRVNARYGSMRRRRGQVINSFLRVIKQDDRQHGYLAGALVVGVQRPETAR
jgi:hypothetical protein